MKNTAALAIISIVTGMFLSGCNTFKHKPETEIPDNLKVPANQVLSLKLHATGVQIYECRPKTDPTQFEWAFKAPKAELFDHSGRKVGDHYAGPTWESLDGSKVIGEVKEKNPGPNSNAIPWLLLNAKSTSGQGIFSQVTSIQRLHTVGGKAPDTGCDASQVGKEVQISYKAAYYFYQDATSGSLK